RRSECRRRRSAAGGRCRSPSAGAASPRDEKVRNHGELETLVTTVARSAFLVLLLAACAENRVDRTRWQRMSAHEKKIYVQSMIGHEEAKAQKGGSGRPFTRPPDEYARRIDAAYAGGDRRNPDTIFEDIGSSR